MESSLEDLIAKWRGRHVKLHIAVARASGDVASKPFELKGILDGPYLNDEPGVGFMLGTDTISGDIAIEGP